MPIYERYTERARRTLILANQEAQRAGRQQIEPEHILLALLGEARGVAAHVLENLGVDPAAARSAAEQAVAREGRIARAGDAELPFSPQAIDVVARARHEARQLKHAHVGTEHLLLALAQQRESAAARAMVAIGILPDATRRQIASMVGAIAESPGGRPSDADAKLRVGIVGVSGYGGGEVLRLCASHPQFQLVYAAGESSAGQPLRSRFPGIAPQLAELIIEKWNPSHLPALDLLFASLPTGESRDALARVPPTVSIVDIGGDHRFVEGWTYGLADVWPQRIESSARIANPGCYPAAAITALAPLLAGGLIEPGDIIIDAKSGVSGAGRGGGSTFGFAEVNEDLAAYGLLNHAHVPEMVRALSEIAGEGAGAAGVSLTFTPHLIPMTRGLLATCYARGRAAAAECLEAARSFYSGRSFVRVVDQPPHTKWAAGSNFAFVTYAADPQRQVVIALCAIDNLGKGAAGQAIQNANLMAGLDETAGLENPPFWP